MKIIGNFCFAFTIIINFLRYLWKCRNVLASNAGEIVVSQGNVGSQTWSDKGLGPLADRLSTALWVYDFDNARIVWANASALKVWNAETREDLAQRDLSEDMSPSVEMRLRQYQTDLVDPERSFQEIWTLYPLGKPMTLDVTYRGYTLDDGRLAMLCEGTVDQSREPETLRSAQALIHTTVKISLFSTTGEALYQNPAARGARWDLDLGFAERFENPKDGEAFLTALKANRSHKMTARIKTSIGPRWHEINGSRCLDSVTGEEAYLVSELDVTDVKEAERRAETADRAKSEFLANMSHELRTPLNAIIGFSDFMMTGSIAGTVPAKYTEYVGDIHESGQHLLQLINDVLDLAKVETGEMPLHLESVSMDDMMKALERIMMPHARKKDVRLSIAPLDAGLAVKADTLRLKQILMNLMSNAIKFTDSGGTITMDARADGGRVAVSVRDTGIGMTPDDIEESLKPFRQVDNSITRSFEGTGLGLPLSKKLADSLGGDLEIESEPGVGTVVTVYLPLFEDGEEAFALAG